METSAVIAAALGQLGSLLRAARTQRGITLTGLARTTGISKSTLSRLEPGQPRSTGQEPAEILSIFTRPAKR